jgi:PucR C-terminal helix-turn-helix domain
VGRGVSEALRQFVALIRDPEAGRDVYVELGRGSCNRAAPWTPSRPPTGSVPGSPGGDFSLAGRRADLDAEILSLLAEAIFAYIDELSADSVEGYAEAQAELEDERRRRARQLAILLVHESPAEEADLQAAARLAGWDLPRTCAALACPEDQLTTVMRRMPADSLAAAVDGAGCILFPDPDGPGRARLPERAANGVPLALGPAGALAELALSWQLTKAALRAAQAGALPASGLLRVDDHLGALLLFEGSAITSRIAARRLAPLEPLTAKAHDRLRQTALAYVKNGGNSVAMADELDIHPQTARYRTARLRELLGDQLDDPDARFELELALRYPSSAGRPRPLN